MESLDTSSEIDLELSEFIETKTVYDSDENSLSPPVTNFNQNFVNLTQLPTNFKLVGNINTKVLVKEDLSPEEEENLDSSENIAAVEHQYNLRGISSFKRFIISKTMPLGKSERLFKTKSRSKENIDQSRSLSRPNILKHKRDDSNDEFDVSLSNSPIKVLAFSPSKFLNNERVDKKLENTTAIMKEISFANISFNPEDSGIENSDIEVSGPISPPSLTSTPMSTRSRRKTALRNLSFLSPESKTNSDSIPLQSTPKGNTSSDENVIKTPVIRKFLNDSAPRTPTPFKCPNNTRDDHDEGINSTIDEPFVSPERDFCFKRPSPISLPVRLHRYSNKKHSEKTARKALILEQDIKRNLFNSKDEENSLATKFLPSTELLHDSDFEQSSLIGQQTFVEKRTFSSKSVYRTRKKTVNEKKSSLNKHWVSVACGRSHDQKVMTEAAKRCLRRRPKPVYYNY